MKPNEARQLPGLAALAGETSTSARLTAQCLEAVERLNAKGPRLHAMIALDPEALDQARSLDAERAGGRSRGALHGAPIVVKDNIETLGAPATTVGSLALTDHAPGREAPAITRLRAAGAVVLGKANLSEWANFRSAHSRSGWSATGGQCRNAIDPARSPCGSSSGSAVAVAAGMAVAAIGTETDGSITCPAAVNGLVGSRPTVGLVSRTGIAPISHHQDTAGPITHCVRDTALLLAAMAGSDSADPTTRRADEARTDFVADLESRPIKGLRVGVMRFAAGFHPATDIAFETTLKTLRAAGAVLIEIAEGPDTKAIGAAEWLALVTEFKGELEAWLATTSPEQVSVRTLTDVIAFNTANAGREMPLFGQDLLEAALNAKGVADPEYLEARKSAGRLAGPEGIDRLLGETRADVLVAPTMGPAWLIDDLVKDHYIGGPATMLAAVAGCPHLTLPMGKVGAMPVGLSVIGPAGSDGRVLAAGHGFEQAIAAALA